MGFNNDKTFKVFCINTYNGRLFFDAEYLINGTQFQWNTDRDLHTPYSTVSFRMILSDLEWLSKIFSDTKRRAVSLRQLSFLFLLRDH